MNARRTLVRVGLAVSLVTLTPGAIDSTHWWHAPHWRSALKLSTSQIAAIDDIYWSTFQERMTRAARADAAAQRVKHLIEADTREADFVAVLDEATQAEASRHGLRTLMLYRIASVLTREQRDRCQSLGLTLAATESDDK